MNYKVSKTLKDNKKSIIIIAVLWVFFTIVLVAPLGYTIGLSCKQGGFDFQVFLENIFTEIVSFTSITRVLGSEYIGYFGKTLLYFTILYNCI